MPHESSHDEELHDERVSDPGMVVDRQGNEELVQERGGAGGMFSAEYGGGIRTDREGPSLAIGDEVTPDPARETGAAQNTDLNPERDEGIVPDGAFDRVVPPTAMGAAPDLSSGRGEEVTPFGSEKGEDSTRAGTTQGGWSTGLGAQQGGEPTGRTTTGGETTTISSD